MKLDKFDKMFDIQYNFTKKIFKEKFKLDINNISKNRELDIKWTKEYILALIKEATEVLDETDWKTHASKSSNDIKDNILEECIDVFKYLLGFLIIKGFNKKQIYNKFIDKSKVVEAKLKQELQMKQISNKEKIVIIDIDGVIASWPETFINFVNIHTDNYFNNYSTMKKTVDRKLLIELKEKYRLSGWKSDMKMLFQANEFIDYLKDEGYTVVIITARPYKIYNRIYSDTINFLDKNKIKYDAIIWEQEKEKYIIEHFNKNQIAFCVDDDIRNVNQLSSNGFDTYYIPNRMMYETEKEMEIDILTKLNKEVVIVKNLNEIREILCKE
jgi:hypothetical protein